MRKSVLAIVGIMALAFSIGISEAKVTTTNPETAQAIKLYKGGNYTQSYSEFNRIVKAHPENALASYYLAMTAAQLGRKDDAVNAYDRVITLSPNGVLGKYAKKGKRCIENPILCNAPDESEILDEEDKFIRGRRGFSEQAQGSYEKLKIENMMREINRYDDIAPQKFKEYKDFSSQAPSDDEIVKAISTLRKAGILGTLGTSDNDLLYMLGTQNSGSSSYDILKMSNSREGLNPQVIQALLTTQMTANF